jgi:hypothetical protein
MHLDFTKILFTSLMLCAISTFAQQKPKQVPNQLSVREISGIVKDSTDVGLLGVTVRLTSDKDTLVTSSNPDGIFIFKNVKSATYSLSFSMLGFSPLVGKYKQNDATPRIVMDPIILKTQSNLLTEIVVNGTPSITYKTDTVEYKASDYIVRENSTVDELVKKMEGMEVGTDGSLVHQGQNVTKAKINGKTYLGGDVATALQNLPAEIVEKVQIVDDYGDQAERTGIKDGDPEKILNIVTKASKSVGNTGNASAGVGNDNRYQISLFATRINGGETIGVNARLNNTVNGVANSGGDNGGGRGGNSGGGSSSNGSGGTTQNGNASFSFRDQLTPKLKVNTSYRYNFNNVNSLNSSFTKINSSIEPIFLNRESESNNDSKNHNFNLELEYELDSNNYLKVTPDISYSSSISDSQSAIAQSGFINQNQLSKNMGRNVTPNLNITAFYQHRFKKLRRNFSVQLSAGNNKQESDQERDIRYYETDINDLDSLVHRLIERENLRSNYRGSITYVEPLNLKSQLEFNGQVNYNGYDNNAITSNIDAFGNAVVDNTLSNIYDYSFTQTRLALNYRYGTNQDSKVRFSLGVTAVPALLSGTKVSLGTTTNRTSFNVIPIARFQYLWSRQHSLQFNYTGNATEPTFDQIQPVKDVSNPQNTIIGNPDLKVTFNHTLNANYNNYIANSKLNYSFNMSATFIEDAVTRNVLQILDDNGKFRNNETRFENIDGVYRINGNYSINKQLNDRKYNLALSGNVNHNHNVSMSNNIRYTTSTWRLSERFGPRINPTEWIEVNPNVSYSYLKSTNTLRNGENNTQTNTLALNIDGKFIMWESLIFGYSASKNFVSGINANLTNNPLVINSYIEKELWKRRMKITFQAFDILNQNNFVNRTLSDNGDYTDTRTNSLSRYFMLRASLRLQKWTGMRGKGGRQMMRRGDGGFY